MKITRLFFALVVAFVASRSCAIAQGQSQYTQLQNRLARGWNTWSYNSMLSHVLLPEGLELKVGFRQSYIGTPYDDDYFLEEVTVDKSGLVLPIAHTYDGSYTELLINGWQGNTIRVQSATQDDDVFILISPVTQSAQVHYYVELQVGMLWNRPGQITKQGKRIVASLDGRDHIIQTTKRSVDIARPYSSAYLSVLGDSLIGFYTGSDRSLSSVQDMIETAKQTYEKNTLKYGDLSSAYKGIQSVLGWNTLYDADQHRIITPVSRGWNEAWQGYVLFEWDTYFASFLFALNNKDLAYSNAIAVTRGQNDQGAVGFFQMPRQIATQSQPPVGSMMCWLIYEKYKDKWFLEEVYDNLLKWNRWWITERLNKGYLTWGAPWKNAELHHAMLESGLDNSPMYEDAKMQEVENHSLMNIADVGLNSLYAADCKYLAKMAAVLGKKSDEQELLARQGKFKDRIAKLWDTNSGLYLNQFLDTSTFSHRLSPTLFYPMLAGIPSAQQAKRMITEHYYNPQEFFGEYMLPSCSRNDKSYNNEYWRGAIWGPMNFLVYLGLRDYDKQTAAHLANASYQLFMKAWNDHHCVFENINSEKGVLSRKDQLNCDPYYHWGALMGIMKFMEEDQY